MMKKLLIALCFMSVSAGAFAQKSYINVFTYISTSYESCRYTIHLSGDVPSDMQKYYYNKDSIGEILNKLSQKGYEVEFMSGLNHGSGERGLNYLLSKKTSVSLNVIQNEMNDNENVTEVARYNLQGIPVNENEKGVHIIVYSNYTTKTIIVQ